jgi:GNAT superfamily N-acetyltransferase
MKEDGMTWRITSFEAHHADAFKALNEAWIGKHFAIEASDTKVLDDPHGQILEPGGEIFMALDEEDEPVGTAALIRMEDGGFEVAKMTVSEAARGSGLGRALMEACIAWAKAQGAPRLYLETNASLAPALALYRASGFVDLPARPTPYARADVFMERVL